jgi:hypothetical protein
MPDVDVVVTRHLGLVKFLGHCGLPPSVPILASVAPEDVHEKRVLGNLPLHLACCAYTVTEPVLEIGPESRGRELSADAVAATFRGFRTYRVELVEP